MERSIGLCRDPTSWLSLLPRDLINYYLIGMVGLVSLSQRWLLSGHPITSRHQAQRFGDGDTTSTSAVVGGFYVNFLKKTLTFGHGYSINLETGQLRGQYSLGPWRGAQPRVMYSRNGSILYFHTDQMELLNGQGNYLTSSYTSGGRTFHIDGEPLTEYMTYYQVFKPILADLSGRMTNLSYDLKERLKVIMKQSRFEILQMTQTNVMVFTDGQVKSLDVLTGQDMPQVKLNHPGEIDQVLRLNNGTVAYLYHNFTVCRQLKDEPELEQLFLGVNSKEITGMSLACDSDNRLFALVASRMGPDQVLMWN